MKKYIISTFLSSILFVGCSDFEEINKNPNQPGVVPASSMLANIVYQTMADDADVGVNGGGGMYSTFIGGDMGSCWAQHWSKVQYNDEERYSPRETALENFWQTQFQVAQNCQKMGDLAVDEGNKNLQGISLLLKAHTFGILTDCYGDIPFSEALKAADGNFTPKYDKQEDVYNGILSLLDQAIALIDEGNGTIPTDSKIMYGNDAIKWKKFAHSLKFRALMRISSKKEVSAELQALVNSGFLFSSTSDDAFITFDEQPAANPVYETIVYGNRGEFKVNSVLVDLLTNLGDPRLPIYAQPAASDGAYRGKPSGFNNVPNSTYGFKNISAIGSSFLTAKAPAYFMTYSELCFLMAEAAQRGLISGSPNTYYEEGISASFKNNGITSGLSSYLAQSNVQLSQGNPLQRIAEQKWIALFGQGIEAWIEWKRTKFPALTPAVDGVITEIPSRYKYPSIEQTINSSSYSAAVSQQGSDLLITKMWWMKP